MKKFYITTSIIYTNNLPHLGAAFEFIQADVLARWHRILKEDVFFLTGTDEHGEKIFKKAKEKNKNPQDFVDEISGKFRELTKALDLSNNDFIRTTDRKRHWPAVEKIWEKLQENNDIYKKKYRGLYCVGCESFVKGKDLQDGKCVIHKKKPEVVEEENYFFRLSKYQDEIRKRIEKDEIRIIPSKRKNEALALIKEGLEDISCSRLRENLGWGIPVPGDNSQTIYVWLEALINYVSALDYNQGERFKKYWPADVHCIGKDILKFHALIWPAMLLSLDLELPKNIFVHGFITSNGEKMSKSLGNIVDPFELVDKYGTDAVRYYLLREIPSTEDGDFTIEKFELRYNSDLASGIGNLVSRVSKMAEGIKQGSKINNPEIKKEIKKAKNNCEKSLQEFKFSEALRTIWELISFCDKYIEKEKPWEKKENSKQVLNDLLFSIDSIADLLEPFLPETSEKIRKRITPLFPRLT